MNLFEYATRNKLRFSSSKGDLTVEQLWDAPLRSSRDDFNLNQIAKTANKALKAATEESFVETTRKTVEETRLEMVMETIKYVIETKMAEEQQAAANAARREEKQKLLQILAEKQDNQLSELSVRELKNRIAALE